MNDGPEKELLYRERQKSHRFRVRFTPAACEFLFAAQLRERVYDRPDGETPFLLGDHASPSWCAERVKKPLPSVEGAYIVKRCKCSDRSVERRRQQCVQTNRLERELLRVAHTAVVEYAGERIE